MSRITLASSLLLILSAFPVHAQPIEVGGSVRGPDGKALPGAAVELVSLGEVERAGPPGLQPAAKATSDAAGAFRLKAPEAGLWKVRVRARGCVPSEIDLIPLIEPVELPPLELALAPPVVAQVEGTLRRAGASALPAERSVLKAPVRIVGSVIEVTSRRALAGALVWPADAPAAFVRTGADGRYSLAIPAGDDLRVRAAAVGYLPSVEPLAVLSGPPDPRGSSGRPGPTVALAPMAALAGTVLDEEGRPVAGAEITAFPASAARPAENARARSGAAGTFHLGHLAPGKTYSIEVVRTGFARAARTVRAPRALTTRSGFRIVLSPGLVARGRVVDGTGRPVAGAVAVLLPSASPEEEELGGARREPPAQGRSDPQGRFGIAGLTGGVFDLQVAARGFATVRIRGLEVRPGHSDLGTVPLPLGARLDGIVVDPADQPIPGATVSAASAAAGSSRFEAAGGGGAVTDSDGRFSVPDLPEGETVTLRVQRPGYLPAPAVVAGIEVPSAGPVRVVLRPGSRVRGRVLDEAGDPLPGARVLLTAAGDRPQDSPGLRSPLGNAISDSAGRFVIAGVEAGRARGRVTAPGFVPGEVGEIEVPSGDDLEGLEVVLRRGAVVEGRVYTAEGGPAAGAVVQVVDDPTAAPLPAYATSAATATTDGDGAYRLEGVGEGRRLIAVAHPEHPGTVGHLVVRWGANRLDLHLPAGSEVTGRVVDAAGHPVGEARVDVSTPALTRETDSLGDGSFRLSGLPDGSYRIAAAKEGFVPVGDAPEVRVGGAPVQGLELRLDRGGAIVGRILGLGPEDLPGVEIWAGGPAGGRAGRLLAVGEYRVENVPAGEWMVRAQVAGSGRQARGLVTLSPGEERAGLDLEFGSGLVLTGRLSRGGAPVDGAGITLRGQGTIASGSGVTDRQGRFRIEGLLPGIYEIQIPLPGEDLYRERLDLTVDRDLTVDLPGDGPEKGVGE